MSTAEALCIKNTLTDQIGLGRLKADFQSSHEAPRSSLAASARMSTFLQSQC
jgi:hypothetical protein